MGDQESSSTFELRWDPRVALSAQQRRAQHDTAQELVAAVSRANELVDRVADLTEQLETLQGDVADAEVEDLEQVTEQIGTTLQELEDLEDQLQRPPNGMGYRDYPRLREQVQSLMRGVMGTQAEPTEGQLQVMAELDVDARRLSTQLQTIIDTTIRQLNDMLGSLPAIVVPTGSETESSAS